MGYREYIQSMGPEVYIDWTDNPLVNLGSGAQPTKVHHTTGATTGEMAPLTNLVNTNLSHTAGDTIVYHSGTSSANAYPMRFDIPMGKSYQTQDWTFCFWIQVSSDRGSYPNISYGQIMQLTPASGGSEFNVVMNRGTAGDWSANVLYIRNSIKTGGTTLKSNFRHVVMRRDATNQKFEIFYNGTSVYSTTSSWTANDGAAGDRTLSQYLLANYGSDGITRYSQNVFFDRALTNQEIRSMSVDYVPLPEEQWFVLESGIEVPLTLEGAWEGGIVVPVTFDEEVV